MTFKKSEVIKQRDGQTWYSCNWLFTKFYGTPTDFFFRMYSDDEIDRALTSWWDDRANGLARWRELKTFEEFKKEMLTY